MTAGRTLILGQARARANDGPDGLPLDGRCARRLERLAGIRDGELGLVFALGNLLPRWPGKASKGDRFPPTAEARLAALAALPTLEEFDRVILLGGNVARAFGVPPAALRLRWTSPTLVASLAELGDRPLFAVLPHPSGVNRWWNDPANAAAAARFLRAAAR